MPRISETRESLSSTFAQAVEVVASAALFPGIDPTGATDSSEALQDSLDATPDGGIWRLPPGTYKASALTVSAKSIALMCAGATLVQAADEVVLSLSGAWDATVALSAAANEVRTYNSSSRNMGKLTFSTTPPTWAPGDVVKVFSDDKVTEAYTGSGGYETRRGEFAVVAETISNDVFLMGPLRDEYTTAPRVARLQPHIVSLDGLAAQTPDAGMSTWTSTLISVKSLIAPQVSGVSVAQAAGPALVFTSCLGYTASHISVDRANSNPGAGQYGYAVEDVNGEGGAVIAIVARNVRHAFTDDSPRTLASSADPAMYGRSRNVRVIAGRAFGTYDVAWNTHHAGEGHSFVDCLAQGADTGAGLRGRNHQVVRLTADSCRVGVSTYTETGTDGATYGHRFVDCVVQGARLDAATIATAAADGRLTATIHGGLYMSTVRSVNVLEARLRLGGGVRLVAPSGALTSSTPMLRLQTDADVTVDGAEIDMSGVTSGSALMHVSLTSASASLSGSRLQLVLPATASRVPTLIAGTGAAGGAVALRDVECSAEPTTAVLGGTEVGARVAYYSPTNVAGAVATT